MPDNDDQCTASIDRCKAQNHATLTEFPKPLTEGSPPERLEQLDPDGSRWRFTVGAYPVELSADQLQSHSRFKYRMAKATGGRVRVMHTAREHDLWLQLMMVGVTMAT